jgi:hypothetical protein
MHKMAFILLLIHLTPSADAMPACGSFALVDLTPQQKAAHRYETTLANPHAQDVEDYYYHHVTHRDESQFVPRSVALERAKALFAALKGKEQVTALRKMRGHDPAFSLQILPMIADNPSPETDLLLWEMQGYQEDSFQTLEQKAAGEISRYRKAHRLGRYEIKRVFLRNDSVTPNEVTEILRLLFHADYFPIAIGLFSQF